jgi:GNAT superfamily N-acetyltransferase
MSTEARTAGAADLDAIVATLTTAFFDDPLWGPAFPDVTRRAAQAGALWRLFATSALRYPWMLVTTEAEAVALWIPPGGDELTEAEAAAFAPLLVEVAGAAVAGEIHALMAKFDAARPAEPHFYLSLLGTHAAHRGRGLGMGLLAESLARIDALGMQAYLESSNPANDVRYQRLGFTPHASIAAPAHTMTTMWRPAAR